MIENEPRIAFYKKKKFLTVTMLFIVAIAGGIGYLKYSKKLWFKADTMPVYLINSASVSSSDQTIDSAQVQIQYTP